jgi:menaquinone-9 beta-reductase
MRVLMSDEFDLIIVGAGPAGCGLALMLSELKLKIALVDKADFPKRKVCGGAISDRALNRLKEFPGKLNIYDDFLKLLKKEESYGVRVFTPGFKVMEFDFKNPLSKTAPGYVCERSDFDSFMIDQVKRKTRTEVFTGTKITKAEVHSGGVKIYAGDRIFEGKMIAGTDGANSIISRQLLNNTGSKGVDVGISAHFENVSGFNKHNLIDVYYIDELLPCYFWVFKLPENKANAGLFLPSHKAKRLNIPLKYLIEEIISKNEQIACRFKNAVRLDDFKGSILPAALSGFPAKKLSGSRVLLGGDAAGIADAITGEGIGNALLSAQYMSKAIKNCFMENDFSKETLSIYDELIRKRLGKEIKLHSAARKLIFSNSLILESAFGMIRACEKIHCRIGKRLYKG